MKRLFRSAAFLLPLALVLGACGDGTGSEMGSISLLLTDAPGDVAAAWVTIDRIYLQPGNGEPDGDGNLLAGPVTVDLVALGDNIVDLVSDEPVDVGYYQELRMVVSEACIAVETDGGYDYYATSSWEPVISDGFPDEFPPSPCNDSDVGDLQTPSFAQSGIKVKLPDGGLELTSEQKILILDFDAAASFIDQSAGHIAGQSGKWVMHPVVMAMDVGTSASITVNLSAPEAFEFPTIGEGEEAVTLGLGDFTVRAYTGDPEAPDYANTGMFTDPDSDGTYSVTLFLDPSEGPFVLEVLLDGFLPTFTGDAIPGSIDLEEGENLVLNLTVDTTPAE